MDWLNPYEAIDRTFDIQTFDNIDFTTISKVCTGHFQALYFIASENNGKLYKFKLNLVYLQLLLQNLLSNQKYKVFLHFWVLLPKHSSIGAEFTQKNHTNLGLTVPGASLDF